MIWEILSLSFNNIRRRKLRSWLSIIGICIGIAAVVSLVSLSQGLNDAISEQFKLIGTDKIIINNGGTFGPPGALETKLNEHDLSIIKKTRGVDTAAGMIMRFVNVKFNEKTATLLLHGLSLKKDEYELMTEVSSFNIDKGRTFKSNDNNKIILGYRLGDDEGFFGKKVKLNDKLIIDGKSFETLGILKKIGSPFEDAHIFLSSDVAEELLNSKGEYDSIFVRTQKGVAPEIIKERIDDNLRKDRILKKGNEDFSVQTFQSITNTFDSIFSIVQSVVLGIVSISLIVGGIGIMNTMYTSVLERTKEIGIMKAVGAKNSHILFIFIIESSLIGLVGGLIGILIGFIFSKTAEFIAIEFLVTTFVRTSISLNLIIFVIFFSIIVGVISGVLPAYQASKLKPVDALRYE